jgi:FkbH-like protein
MTLNRDLAWLPRPPADWRARLSAIERGDTTGPALVALATYALDGNQLTALARRRDRLTRGEAPFGLDRVRLGVIGGGTLDLVVPQIAASGLRHGLWLDMVDTAFGLGLVELLDPASTFHRAKCDVVLLAFDYRDLLPAGAVAHGAEQAAAAALDQLAMLAAIIRDNGVVPIVQTLAPPPETELGSFDLWRDDGLLRAIAAVNFGLRDAVAASGAALFDVGALAAQIGLDEWHDPAAWFMAKLQFAPACVPRYAEGVARVVSALRGRSRRCLVLDLDNTLWGGVLGDDGIAGIRLGHGSAEGEAHLALQAHALALRACGIVLAISSKNEEGLVRKALREHPDMLLREDHFAVIHANWIDKASNLEAIAEGLALGLGSLVFVDDNPAERALVRQKLPSVAVPELPGDPALYVRTLAAGGYFEAVALSAEDRARSGYYEGNARRRDMAARHGGLTDYLASLAMTISFAAFKPVDRTRIAQLIAKSNQFNLTTRRHSEVDIEAMEVDPVVLTLQVRLSDTFGDNGLISVVIGRLIDAMTLEIDTWLMSCRVLGRRVEEAVLHELCLRACERGVTTLRGIYRPTVRNGLVRDHYARLGFERVGDQDDGGEIWQRNLVPIDAELPFSVVSDRATVAGG